MVFEIKLKMFNSALAQDSPPLGVIMRFNSGNGAQGTKVKTE